MLPVVFQVDLFRKRAGQKGAYQDWQYSQQCLKWMLEALINCNREYLRRFPTPPMYQTGVRYAREDGTEDWVGIPILRDRLYGDCEDLAAWRVAELREQGEPARALLKFRRDPNGYWHYHIQVLRYQWNGQRWVRRMEDPSRLLGMNTPQEAKILPIVNYLKTNVA